MVNTEASPTDLYTLQLRSALTSLNQLEGFIDQIKLRYQLNEEVYANVMACLNEACVNAIVHGNRLSPNLKVYLNLEVFVDKKLVFTVTDEGEGFDYETLPDPTAPENLEKEAGRGVFIIRRLADQCIFNNKGNQVELHFNI
jgi:serine/threonine-protein kinase RsbW